MVRPTLQTSTPYPCEDFEYFNNVHQALIRWICEVSKYLRGHGVKVWREWGGGGTELTREELRATNRSLGKLPRSDFIGKKNQNLHFKSIRGETGAFAQLSFTLLNHSSELCGSGFESGWI
ncbi:hypothetical protein TNCV_2654911 [Trichonephila clavipes]|nr:hypothetical protein TNCV_2654911 [Trichonephila clavipes]